jgi:Tfp pilus assembly protein PilO
VTFTVKGNYFALAEFLFNVETLPRVAKVQNVTISAAGETSGTTSSVPFLQMTGAVTFYTTDTSSGPGSDPAAAQTGSGATGTSTSPSPTAPAG